MGTERHGGKGEEKAECFGAWQHSWLRKPKSANPNRACAANRNRPTISQRYVSSSAKNIAFGPESSHYRGADL
jgi:hypothetical protein